MTDVEIELNPVTSISVTSSGDDVGAGETVEATPLASPSANTNATGAVSTDEVSVAINEQPAATASSSDNGDNGASAGTTDSGDNNGDNGDGNNNDGAAAGDDVGDDGGDDGAAADTGEHKTATKKKKKKKANRDRGRSQSKKNIVVNQGADLTFDSLTDDLKVYLVRLRRLALTTAVLHTAITIILYVMGYSAGGTGGTEKCELASSCLSCVASKGSCGWCVDGGVCLTGSLTGSTQAGLCQTPNATTVLWSFAGAVSPTCAGNTAIASPMTVVCAFGALATVLFSFTSLWHTYQNTNRPVSRPKFHHQSFFAAVVRGFSLIFFMWPGLVSYIISSLGSDFTTLLDSVSRSVRAVAVVHILIFIGVAAVNVVIFAYASARLRTFRQAKDEQEKLQSEDQKDQDELTRELVANGETELKTLTVQDSLLAIVAVIAYLVLIADLIIVVARTNFNSGTALSVVVMLVLLVFFVICYYQLVKPAIKTYSKHWLNNYRVFTLVHLTAMVVAFWVCLCILLLIEHYNTTFFEAIINFGGERTALCLLQLILFVVVLIQYGFTLYNHQRALNILDELGGLNLIQRANK